MNLLKAIIAVDFTSSFESFKPISNICKKSLVLFLTNSSFITYKSDKYDIINKANFLAKKASF